MAFINVASAALGLSSGKKNTAFAGSVKDLFGGGSMPVDNSHTHSSKSKDTYQAPGTTPSEKNMAGSLATFTGGMFDVKNINRSGRAITNEELGTTFDVSQGSIQPIENIAQPPSPIQDVPVPVPNDIDAVNMNVLYNK